MILPQLFLVFFTIYLFRQIVVKPEHSLCHLHSKLFHHLLFYHNFFLLQHNFCKFKNHKMRIQYGICNNCECNTVEKCDIPVQIGTIYKNIIESVFIHLTQILYIGIYKECGKNY